MAVVADDRFANFFVRRTEKTRKRQNNRRAWRGHRMRPFACHVAFRQASGRKLTPTTEATAKLLAGSSVVVRQRILDENRIVGCQSCRPICDARRFYLIVAENSGRRFCERHKAPRGPFFFACSFSLSFSLSVSVSPLPSLALPSRTIDCNDRHVYRAPVTL